MGIGSIWPWVIVLIVVLLVFGTSKLKNIGKDLGGALKDFKTGMKDENSPEDSTSKTTEAIDTTAKEVKKENVSENTAV